MGRAETGDTRPLKPGQVGPSMAPLWEESLVGLANWRVPL